MDLLFSSLGTSKTNIIETRNVSIRRSLWVIFSRPVIQDRFNDQVWKLSNMSCNCYQSIWKAFRSCRASNQNPIKLISSRPQQANTFLSEMKFKFLCSCVSQWNLVQIFEASWSRKKLNEKGEMRKIIKPVVREVSFKIPVVLVLNAFDMVIARSLKRNEIKKDSVMKKFFVTRWEMFPKCKCEETTNDFYFCFFRPHWRSFYRIQSINCFSNFELMKVVSEMKIVFHLVIKNVQLPIAESKRGSKRRPLSQRPTWRDSRSSDQLWLKQHSLASPSASKMKSKRQQKFQESKTLVPISTLLRNFPFSLSFQIHFNLCKCNQPPIVKRYLNWTIKLGKWILRL